MVQRSVGGVYVSSFQRALMVLPVGGNSFTIIIPPKLYGWFDNVPLKLNFFLQWNTAFCCSSKCIPNWFLVSSIYIYLYSVCNEWVFARLEVVNWINYECNDLDSQRSSSDFKDQGNLLQIIFWFPEIQADKVCQSPYWALVVWLTQFSRLIILS